MRGIFPTGACSLLNTEFIMKKLLLPLTALALIFSTPSHAQDEGAGGFGDFGDDDGGRGMDFDDQKRASDLIYTKGLTVQTKKPIAIEQFIEILESKDSGIGQKINVFIDAKAAGTRLAPVNVRNVSAWTLLKTIAPHADLEVDIIKSNTPKRRPGTDPDEVSIRKWLRNFDAAERVPL